MDQEVVHSQEVVPTQDAHTSAEESLEDDAAPSQGLLLQQVPNFQVVQEAHQQESKQPALVRLLQQRLPCSPCDAFCFSSARAIANASQRPQLFSLVCCCCFSERLQE